MSSLDELEKAAELVNNLPAGTLAAIRRQETGGQSKYIEDPTTYHYEKNAEGRRIAGHTGKVSTAFGPYGILESTARDPGYGVTPLGSKGLADQVNFAASYLSKRSERAGSLEAGLAGYGEGAKYSNQVMARMNGGAQSTGTTQMATSNIDSMASGNIQRNDVAALALEQTYGAMDAAYGAVKQSMAGTAEDMKVVKTVEAMAAADAATKAKEFAGKIGTDPSAASYALSRLVDESNALYQKQQEIGTKLAESANPDNFAKNPLGFLWDRAMLPNRVREFNTVTQMANSATNRIATLHNLTQAGAQTMRAISQPITAENALAYGRLAAAEINTKVQVLELDRLKTNAEGVMKISGLKNNNMDIALRARDQQIQEVQVDIARQSAEFQALSLTLGLEERQANRDMKQEEIENRNVSLAAINLGRKSSNLPEFSTWAEMKTYATTSKEAEQAVNQQYVTGFTAAKTGRAVVGATPWEATKYKLSTGATFTDGRAKLFQFMEAKLQTVQQDPKVIAATKGKEAAFAPVYNETIKSSAAEMLANIVGGEKNIYAPPPTMAFLEDPTFKGTYTAQKLLAPMQKGGMEALPLKEVTELLLEDMSAGKISPAQVDNELGFLAEKIKGYNNELYRYQDTAGLPNMTTVKIPLPNTSSLTNAVNFVAGKGTAFGMTPMGGSLEYLLGGQETTVVDISNPVARAEYINRRQAQLIPPVLRQQAAKQTKTGN